jgi:hypothetical protein
MAPARMMRSFDAAHYRRGALPMRRTTDAAHYRCGALPMRRTTDAAHLLGRAARQDVDVDTPQDAAAPWPWRV